MKNVYPLILLLILSLLGACKKAEYTSELFKSKEIYIAFKASTGNNYKYVVATSSWTGYSSATTLTIKDGKVVGRAYISKMLVNNVVKVDKEWIEDAATLGSHTEGAALRNLDDVYEIARKEWLKKRDDADVYFEAKNDGMISSAGYVNKGCQDDCFNGISISAIAKL
ncbi:hypothetical protein [Chitinophaga sancti]|uniref:Lipoprotein n=1 Tax=Chitinophaga sancti TaxID=1004 RepID=A0A1K1SR08_9BACT|nr:hypothetical protein [Chitinophaga sancti]WQD61064.1 hypothetical protein U0033_24500 [Chitinophaga sancti]WQG86807.1 hypothetical protein SR876_17965 [Chitinophaga sancti]SFW86652.1 hypothetical protein SAMN05661012_05945 [Chitinophaga sancti]